MEKKSFSLEELAAVAEGEVVGDAQLQITDFAPLETADSGDISFLVKAGEYARLNDFKGSAVIVPMEIETAEVALIRVVNPYLASARVHSFLLEKPFEATGVHPRAWVAETVAVPELVSIAPMACIGE
ncbi:MAG: UDP-3-O-(3-hydroxymyristoyl)glucosamine N-acyltransferase, partial [Desulfocapsa sp.]